jgi:hypothetical protein
MVGHFVSVSGTVAIYHMGKIRNASTVLGIRPEMREIKQDMKVRTW